MVWVNEFLNISGKLTKTDENKKIELLFKFFSTSSTFHHHEFSDLNFTDGDGNQSI